MQGTSFSNTLISLLYILDFSGGKYVTVVAIAIAIAEAGRPRRSSVS
jgi:hypothetical protein